jgi:DNA-binding winged helix-turn-helix (wHTH) protein/tetratricopeptide (TPR) repeat protein
MAMQRWNGSCMFRHVRARSGLLRLAFWALRYQTNIVQAPMIYRFQDFELDEARLELRRGGVDVAIQARVLRALIYLVKHRDRVVSKDELCDAVWQDLVVSDAALAQVVMHARKALGDEGEQQTLLKTVRGRGFRFIAEARETTPAAESGSTPQPPAHTLVGREPELQTLHGLIAAAQTGRGLCALISGDPGIGKTALVEALAAVAHAHAFEVAWGKAWEDGGAPPFWPFIQVLRALVERHGLEHLQRASGARWNELAALVADPAAAPMSADSANNRFRLFDAMQQLLRALSLGPRPQLVVLEDLHGCDEASLSMLRYLSRELSGARLLLVGTFRELALSQQPALRGLVDSVPANQRIQLPALAARDCDLLLAKSLGEAPSQRLAAAVYELSGGNPLCIAELGRQVVQGNLPFPLLTQASAVPERVAHAVRMQLSAMPSPAVDALLCASALGRSFAQPLLAQLLQLTELQLLERLAPALACGLLQAAGNAGVELSFAHALMRGAVYAELPSHRRAQLHLQIAQLLEQRGEPLPLHELAHHYHLAASSGGRKQAIDFALRASEHAFAMRAFEMAAELQERAFALSELGGANVDELLERAFYAGAICYAAGQLQRAVFYFDRAAEIARQQKAHVATAEAVGAASLVMRGTLLFDRPRQLRLREALLALPEGDSPIKAMLLPASTLCEHSGDALLQRRAAVATAIAMARRLNDRAVLSRTLSVCHHALWGVAHPRELTALTTEQVEVARGACDSELLLDALVWRMSDSIELGDDEALAAASGEYLALLDGHHSGWHRYMAAILQCVQLTCYGELDRAEALSLRALEIGKQQQEPSAHTLVRTRDRQRPTADLPARRPRRSPGGAAPGRAADSGIPADLARPPRQRTLGVCGRAQLGPARRRRGRLALTPRTVRCSGWRHIHGLGRGAALRAQTSGAHAGPSPRGTGVSRRGPRAHTGTAHSHARHGRRRCRCARAWCGSAGPAVRAAPGRHTRARHVDAAELRRCERGCDHALSGNGRPAIRQR